jgi:hypothetical protein
MLALVGRISRRWRGFRRLRALPPSLGVAVFPEVSLVKKPHFSEVRKAWRVSDLPATYQREVGLS